jgi:hypothetical protein
LPALVAGNVAGRINVIAHWYGVDRRSVAAGLAPIGGLTGRNGCATCSRDEGHGAGGE